jgi:phage baseplate assembly protein W
MAIRKTDIVYSDLRNDLAPNPATGDIMLRTNEQAIEYSIVNLLTTNRYERLFQPEIGSGILDLLFENDTPATVDILKEQIIDTINNYEPRCVLIDVIIIPRMDDNTYEVEITFKPINSSEARTFSFVLDRTR